MEKSTHKKEKKELRVTYDTPPCDMLRYTCTRGTGVLVFFGNCHRKNQSQHNFGHAFRAVIQGRLFLRAPQQTSLP